MARTGIGSAFFLSRTAHEGVWVNYRCRFEGCRYVCFADRCKGCYILSTTVLLCIACSTSSRRAPDTERPYYVYTNTNGIASACLCRELPFKEFNRTARITSQSNLVQERRTVPIQTLCLLVGAFQIHVSRGSMIARRYVTSIDVY